MKGEWLSAFRGLPGLLFTEEEYGRLRSTVELMLPLYLKYLPEKSTMLECCCGVGSTAIPLSHSYRVTAFDRDSRILEYARWNAARYGGDIKIVEADFRDIGRVFGPESFDSCSSTGVLEHFQVSEIRELMDLQLSVAPIVCIGVSLGDGSLAADSFGITSYGYTQSQWLGEILGDYDVIEHMPVDRFPAVCGGRDCRGLVMVVT